MIELKIQNRLIPDGEYRLRWRSLPDGGASFTLRSWLAAVVPLVFFGMLILIVIDGYRFGSSLDFSNPITFVVIGLGLLPLLIGIWVLFSRKTAIFRPDGSVLLVTRSLVRRRCYEISSGVARLDLCQYTRRANAVASLLGSPLGYLMRGPRESIYIGLVVHDGDRAMLLGLGSNDKKLDFLAERIRSEYGLIESNSCVKVVSG